jgi:hypothetical protein
MIAVIRVIKTSLMVSFNWKCDSANGGSVVWRVAVVHRPDRLLSTAHPKNLTPEEKRPVCETQNLPQSPAAVWRTSFDTANSKYLNLKCGDCRCPWDCGRSFAEIAGSNPASGMDACLLWVLCIVRWRSLRWADHSSRGVLPIVWVSSWNLLVGAHTQ